MNYLESETKRFRVLLVSRDGMFVGGHHEYHGEALPDIDATILVRSTGERGLTIRARVTDVTPGVALPIAAVELDG